MQRVFTPEQEAWIRERYADWTNAELVDGLRETFGIEVERFTLCNWAHHHAECRKTAETISRGRSKPYRFTVEMCDFLREYIPGRLRDEVNDEFERHFGWRLSKTQYSNIKLRLGVRAGVFGGRFEKGQVPKNKGKKWSDYMSEESQQRVLNAGNLFKKGQVPHNRYHELLDERTDKDGSSYVYVRPRNATCSARMWVSKAQFVWMQTHGREFPERHRCIHANHDNTDYSPDNLVAVPEEIYGIVTGTTNGHALEYWDKESLEASMAHALLTRKRLDIERTRPRKCEVCGETFVPTGKRVRYGERVRTCDACVKKGKRAPMRRKESE